MNWQAVRMRFCEWDKPDHRNGLRVDRSLAFQLATRLSDYGKLRLTLPEMAELDWTSPSDLFDHLVAEVGILDPQLAAGSRWQCRKSADLLESSNRPSAWRSGVPKLLFSTLSPTCGTSQGDYGMNSSSPGPTLPFYALINWSTVGNSASSIALLGAVTEGSGRPNPSTRQP
jgi:hypothetical protein